MKDQAYYMTMLFDFYGQVLTPRQQEFYDLYHNEDLSLSEIAEHYGITRQGVRDVIVRAEAVLSDLEEKTGLLKRFHQVQGELHQIQDITREIISLGQQEGCDQIARLAQTILDIAQQMEKE